MPDPSSSDSPAPAAAAGDGPPDESKPGDSNPGNSTSSDSKSSNSQAGDSKAESPKSGKPSGTAIWWIIASLLSVFVVLLVVMELSGSAKTLSFSDFRKGLLNGEYTAENVHNLTFTEDAVHFANRPLDVSELTGDKPSAKAASAEDADPAAADASPESTADDDDARGEATEANDANDANDSAAKAKPDDGVAAEEFQRFTVPLVGFSPETRSELSDLLIEKGIEVSGSSPEVNWNSVVGIVLVLAILGLLLFSLARYSAAGNPLAFGRSRGKMYADDDVPFTFDDVAGQDEAVEELREVVEFLKTPEKYQALGGRIPKGVLLVGPPGTGKTLLAKAVAGEAGVPFFSLSGSDFVEMYVGVGAARVRDMFQQAVAKSPSIIFIDELDALGKVRGSGMPGGHDEREQTLNALLVEMDGFASDDSVIVMGATNRPETLDPALMRPGRFDRNVLVDRPDYKGREAILKVHGAKRQLAPEVDLAKLAKLTPGFVGADLENLCNEAALLAARAGKTAVGNVELEEAIERVVAGLEKTSKVIQEDEKIRVAYHECGHALVACVLPNTDPVHKISIIPRGLGALGYTLQRPEEDRHLITVSEIRNRICCLLGGIAAEDTVFEEASTGASNDLERSTDMARRMVTEFGMSRKLGRVNYAKSGRSPFLAGAQSGGPDFVNSEKTLREIDEEVKRIIDECMATAREIMRDHRAVLERMTRDLLEVEVMDADQLADILSELNVPVPTAKPATTTVAKDGLVISPPDAGLSDDARPADV